MNRILVITFTRDSNPGTFMQAYGVRTGLQRIWPGAEIDFLDFPNFKKGKRSCAEPDAPAQALRRKVVAALRLLKYKRLGRRVFRYSRPIDLFNYSEEETREVLGGYDLVVVGSDTILEQAVNAASGQVGLQWAAPLYGRAQHVLFAASAAPALFSDDEQTLAKLRPLVAGFSFIGLRDELTGNLFRQGLGVKAALLHKQPDPTYLLPLGRFALPAGSLRRLERLRQRCAHGVVLCNFDKTFPFRRELPALLRGAGYGTVSTTYSPHVDLSLGLLDAFEWAGLFRHLDAVVTERFHDSLFAIRSGTPVVAVDWSKDRMTASGDSKTFRILQDYGLEAFHLTLRSADQLPDIVGRVPAARKAFAAAGIGDKVAAYEKAAEDMLCRMASAVGGGKGHGEGGAGPFCHSNCP